MAQKRKGTFDATWLPFGMTMGIAVGIGTGLVFFENIWLGAAFGVALGLAFGIALGAGKRKGVPSDEDVEDGRHDTDHEP